MFIIKKIQGAVSPQMALAAAFFFAGFMCLVSTYLALVVFRNGHDGTLGPYGVAQIESTVAGVNGPAVIQGGTLSLGIERCVNSDDVIQVEVTVGFRNETPGGTPATVPYLTRAIQPRFPGCNFSLIPMPLPSTVGPGTWRVEGISRAVASSEVRYWASEPFTVVEQR
jgi:hypothetical protein